MLTDEQLYKLTEKVIDVAREIEFDLIQSIAKRIDVNDAIGGTTEWQLRQLNQLGLLNADNLKIIAEKSGKTIQELIKMIESTGRIAIDYKTLDKVFNFGLISINPRTINLEPVLDTFKETLTNEVRLVLTRAITQSNLQYQAMIDKVALEVTGGYKSYNESILTALNELSEQGINATKYQGVDKNGNPYEINYSIEASIRRSTMTAVNQVANSVNEKVIDELKPPQIAVSQHLGARNKGIGYENHERWQGKVYDNNGEFERVTGYGEGDMLGLGGYNCRHIHWAYYEGISPPLEERISDEENSKQYLLEQRQRLLERRVREARRRLKVAQTTEDIEHINESKKLVEKRLKILDEFVTKNDLTRQYERERISKKYSE